jgi:hypothetical protein
MKGISATLMIIVTAIVILIAALVVLYIFSDAIWPIAEMTEARNTCIQQAGVTCAAGGIMPPTWEAQFFYKVGDVKTKGSCSGFYPSCGCVDNKLVDCTLA